MGYIDEQIVEEKYKYKKGIQGDIHTGLYMKEHLMEFERIHLLDDRLSIMIPKEFGDMDEDLVKLRYISEQRPKIIKESPDGMVNFCFNLLEVPIYEEALEQVMQLMKNALKNSQPADVFYESEIRDVTNTKVAWFDFKSYTTDDPVYNIFVLLSVGGKLVHIVLNCKFSLKDLWKPVMLQVVDSIIDETH